MSKPTRSILLGSVALAASLAASAQAPAPATGAQAVPGAPQGALYSSAFEGYRPFSADEVGDWRKANDTVREIGGWRAYAREIQGGTHDRAGGAPAASAPAGTAAPGGPAASAPRATPAPAAPAASTPAPAGRPNPHQGHH